MLQADPRTHIANISVQSCHAVKLEETTPFSRCLACGMLASFFSLIFCPQACPRRMYLCNRGLLSSACATNFGPQHYRCVRAAGIELPVLGVLWPATFLSRLHFPTVRSSGSNAATPYSCRQQARQAGIQRSNILQAPSHSTARHAPKLWRFMPAHVSQNQSACKAFFFLCCTTPLFRLHQGRESEGKEDSGRYGGAVRSSSGG